jgi:adenylate cyclase
VADDAPRGDVSDLIAATRQRFLLRITFSNVVGGVSVFFFLAVVLPLEDGPSTRRILELNLPAGIVFTVVSFFVGTRWGGAIADRSLAPLRKGGQLDADGQRGVLRGPLAQLVVTVTIWAAAAVFFALLNIHLDRELAARMGTAFVMGGLVACGLTYLVGERLWRPFTVRALEAGVPLRPVAPGAMTRMLLAWALASGIPATGIAMVAFGVLIGDTPRHNATMWSIIFLCLVAVTLGAVAILGVARSIAEPIQSVREGLDRVERGDLDNEITVSDASEVGLLQAGFNRMGAGLREREELRDLFGRYVGEDVARRALDAGVELGGEVREAAVLFVDVIGSTSLAAELPPQEVVARLNKFFSIVLDVVRAHGGWVNKFEGDAALCVFGVPTAGDDAAACALAAGRELAARLEREGTLEAGVGISAGEVVAGNVGAAERFEYTVIGDPVNEAARLTELAKQARPRVLASEAVLRRASRAERERWELGRKLVLDGRAEPTRIAAPAGSLERVSPSSPSP